MRVSVRLRSSAPIYYLFSRQPKYRNLRFRAGFTEVVIEGFPRSGNSWLFNVVQFLYPDLHIAHHMHSIVPIQMALRNRLPAYCLIRNPLDSIASFAAFISENGPRRKDSEHFERNIGQSIQQYLAFHSKLLGVFQSDRRNGIRLVQFDRIFSDRGVSAEEVDKVLMCLASDFGQSDHFAGLENLMKEVKKRHEDYNAAHGIDLLQSVLPNAKKQELRLIVRNTIERSPALFAKFECATQLFSSLTANELHSNK